MNITFIGAGNMASALISGLYQNAAIKTIWAIDPFATQRDKLSAQYGVTCLESISAEAACADVIVFAVKPQQMQVACGQLGQHHPKGLLISIAAGTRMDSITQWTNLAGAPLAIVRAMPNTPATLGKGITGLVANQNATEANRLNAEFIMRAVGEVLWVENESMIDAVTAVSGSGPGYVFYLMEALQSGAEKQGFTKEQARLLAAHTFAGAAQLALHSSHDFGTLREQVTSKGGTTFAGLETLRAHQVGQHIEEAIDAAKKRAEELGKLN